MNIHGCYCLWMGVCEGAGDGNGWAVLVVDVVGVFGVVVGVVGRRG